MDTDEASPRPTGLAWPAAIAGIVAFSFSAALYKLSGAPPAVGSALRFAYATLFLALLAWRAGVLRPGPGFAPAAAAGVIVGVEVVIWNEATGRIGAGPSTVIVNTASLWVMVLTVVVLRRPVGWRPVAGAAVVLGGLALLRGTGEHRLEVAGIVLAIVAAALYGAFILVFERAVSAARDGISPVLWSTAVAVPVSAACAVVLGESWQLDLGQHAWLALLGVAVQACGWLLIARSLSSFSAVAVSVLLLLQPALAAVWGVAFLDETLIAIQVAGIAVVLLGVTLARPRADRAPQVLGGGHAVVLLAHQRAREHEVRRRAIAGDRHVVDDRDAQQRLHVDVVRVRLQRVPEEDHEVDATFRDRGAHLLIAAQRSAQEAVDVQSELTRELRARRAGGMELVLREGASVVARPLEHVGLAIVVRDQGELLAAGHRRRDGVHGGLRRSRGEP